MFCMDHIFKTTVAIALKSLRPCSSTFSEHNGTKKGAGDHVRAAAAMFESARPNYTAKKGMYICRPNSSSQQLYSLYIDNIASSTLV